MLRSLFGLSDADIKIEGEGHKSHSEHHHQKTESSANGQEEMATNLKFTEYSKRMLRLPNVKILRNLNIP